MTKLKELYIIRDSIRLQIHNMILDAEQNAPKKDFFVVNIDVKDGLYIAQVWDYRTFKSSKDLVNVFNSYIDEQSCNDSDLLSYANQIQNYLIKINSELIED